MKENRQTVAYGYNYTITRRYKEIFIGKERGNKERKEEIF